MIPEIYQRFKSLSYQKKQILLFVILILTCCYARAQVSNSGNLYVAGNMYINSDFSNTSSGSYENEGSVYLTGNFTNNQAFMTEGAGITNFLGGVQQTINGSQSPDFHDVIMNNSSGIKMNVNIVIGGTISPVIGSLYFNNYALAMGGKVSNAYTNTKTFSVTNSSDLIVYGNATAGSNLFFDSSANTIHDVTVNSSSSAAIGNALNITSGSAFGTVTVDGQLDANGFVTFKSDANGTAREASSAGTVLNYVTVERYIGGRRAWRFMSAPIVNDTLHIRTAWQEGVNNHDLIYANHLDPNPGFGTDITGDNDYTKGFDDNTTFNPSIRTWVQSTSSFSATSPPTVSTLINSFSAYCLFVRGSRAVNLALATSAPVSNTILRAKGRLSNNTYSASVAANNGDYLFVGNPFASSIDLSKVLAASSGVNKNKFYLWDPAINGSYGVGAYITYDHGVMVPSTPNYPSATTIVQGEQGFLFQSNSTGASLVFAQTAKSGSEKNVFNKVQADSDVETYPRVLINLMMPSADSLLLVDGVGAVFDNQFSTLIDQDDAIKFPNFNESIALLRYERRMAIEARPMPVLRDTLFLKMTYLAAQPYTLSVLPLQIPADLQGWLIDRYLNTSTRVSNSDTTLYNFTPNSDTLSYLRRFMIVYQLSKIATPVAASSFNYDAKTELNKISIFPNPVTTGSFNLTFNNLIKDDYRVDIFSNDGKLISTNKIEHPGGSNAYNIKLDASMAAGIYSVSVTGVTDKITHKTSLVISKN